MDPLQELAAANQGRGAVNVAVQPKPPAWRARPAKKNWPAWALPAAIGGVLVAAAGLTLLLGGAMMRQKPEFRIHRDTLESGGGILLCASWQITNEGERPLIVRKVTYNGEYVATGNFSRGTTVTSEAYPVTLRIGETTSFLEYHYDPASKSYGKRVIFIDIETNRGDFRYRPGEGFEK